MRTSVTFFLFIFSLQVFGQGIQPTEVLNPKKTSNGYVSDVYGLLDKVETDSITRILDALERRTTVQSAVVVLNSIGDQDVFTFSQDLFNHWGIGHSENNNGLLILLIIDQKTVRIHTGYGLEGLLPDATTKRIQAEEMVPHFKKGEFGKGLLMGVQKIVRILESPKAIEEVKTVQDNAVDLEMIRWILFFLALTTIAIWYWIKRRNKHFDAATDKNNFPSERIGQGLWLIFYGVVPVLLMVIGLWIIGDLPTFFLAVYGYAAVMFFWRRLRMGRELREMEGKKLFRRAYQYLEHRQTMYIVLSVIFPLPFLILIPFYFRKKQQYRTCARPCHKCDKVIHARLDEKTDDEHLSLSQKFEESIESLDYDVWFCRSCGAKEILRYPGKKSGYEECPKCAVQAYYLESAITLVSATTSLEGLREETKACKYCGLVAKRKYSVPKLETSTSGGSGSSGSGSFGGGRSGGGGSSSSW
ncbi:MAG: TPM domain-containing protein [Bacteroidetes bacterium]|nr:TPM domain-containing protein [Bacteroidota bacterium]